MAHFARRHRALYEEHDRELWRRAGTGELRPVVHAEFPLVEAAAAHKIIEARANLGKVALRP